MTKNLQLITKTKPLPTPYVYVFVRTDISFEQQIVQACHACVEAAPLFLNCTGTANLVLLEASDEKSLLRASMKLEKLGIRHALFHEPDDNMGYSALTTQILYEAERKPLRRYQLYKIRDK